MTDSLFDKPERFAPHTIWTGDNLDILRGMNSETVARTSSVGEIVWHLGMNRFMRLFGGQIDPLC